MRILFISSSAQIGGGNRSLLLLACGLRKRGHGVVVVVPGQGPMSDACSQMEFELYVAEVHQPSWSVPGATWHGWRRWKKLLRTSRTDIVHANDLMTMRSVSLAAWSCGIPVVSHVRFPFQVEFAQWVFRGLPKPQALAFNSHALKRELGALIEVTAPKATQTVVHNAVDLAEFASSRANSRVCRIGIVANLVPIKGHRDFLHMARCLRDRRIRAEYWIIGDDIHCTGYRTELETMASNLELSGAIRFLGHCNGVSGLLNHLDIVVCASHVEPFGRCLIEAMACERPVVATRVGGIPEVIEDGITGILVPPHCPTDLANAVEKLIGDPKLRERMGAAGRRLVEQRFNVDTHVEQILKIYHSVLEKSGRRTIFRESAQALTRI